MTNALEKTNKETKQHAAWANCGFNVSCASQGESMLHPSEQTHIHAKTGM